MSGGAAIGDTVGGLEERERELEEMDQEEQDRERKKRLKPT
jgi:hypothetical protein